MGDFEVTLTFSVNAQDRFDAARQVYVLIKNKTPSSFWVCNEGGVGDEVRIDGNGGASTGAAPEATVHELVEDLYRLGVQFGAGNIREVEGQHNARVDGLKRRLISAAAANVSKL